MKQLGSGFKGFPLSLRFRRDLRQGLGRRRSPHSHALRGNA